MPQIILTFKPSLASLGNAFKSVNVSSFVSYEINEIAMKVVSFGKQLSPVDTGLMRSRINQTGFSTAQSLRALVEVGVNYACVFGANTRVVTKNNSIKRIANVKVGDFVLSQDGKYHKVLATHKYSAEKKPNMVTFVAEWRKDRKHKLTLTEDHKVLVEMNGATYWKKAGDLKCGDILFQRKKIPINIGVGKKYIVKVCINCLKEYIGQGKKYCSVQCRDEVYRKNHPQAGCKRNETARKNIAKANIKKLREHPERHPNRVLAQNGFRTKIENEIEQWLVLQKVKFIRQHRLGKYYVDFYCPHEKIVIEADGAYWHQDQQKDIERDREILKYLQNGWMIKHFHFVDKRFSKNIDSNPIDRVYYQQLNPGIKSYVDLGYFKPSKILSVKHWKYKRLRQSCVKSVYDLTVKDVHSFIASGIIISNCFVHEGTRYMRARPFMETGANLASENFAGNISSRLEKGFVDAFKRLH